MELNIKKLKAKNTAIGSVIVIVTLVTCHSFHKTSLVDLQKEILAAKTASDTLKVIDRLEKYYLTTPIPDSIHQRVQAEVDTAIKHQERIIPLAIINSELDTNIYQVEADLKQALKEAMVARARGADSTFQTIIQHTKLLADTVDSGTDNHYWRAWVEKVENFNSTQARNWLLADRSESLCYSKHLKSFYDAEKYGALGLQLLQQIGDERLRLDIMQRLMIILFRSRGMYDLSFGFAQNVLKKADEIKYHLRANGILYNYGEVLHLAGKNQLALRAFLETVHRATKYNKVPYIEWYKKNGLIGIARSNWQVGNYKQVLTICAEVEKFELNAREKILLHITRGLAERSLGNYEDAKDEYLKAFDFAKNNEDFDNQIEILRNMGTMYQRLSEYEKAADYFKQAMKLHQEHSPKDIVTQSAILICLAETKIALNETQEINSHMHKASNLISQIDIPIMKAELLRSLGRMNVKLNRNNQAYNQFLEAINLYESHGLFRAGLETQIDFVNCLINLSKYKEAKQLLGTIYKTSKNIGDSQREIESIGMMAEVAQLEGNVDAAIQYSNKLITEIDQISTRFKDIDNLSAFRQKVHEYLKKAVFYELENGRLDSAFVKLDYIKARVLKDKLDIEGKNGFKRGSNSHFVNIEKIKEQLKQNQLIISYFVTQDTLFAFALDHDNLQLFKKTIKLEQLENIIKTYLESINKTIDFFEYQPTKTFIAHFDSTVTLSQHLYQILLNWSELQNCLNNSEITYIIPDDILHSIPFSCLMNSETRESKFIINQTAIAYLPGAIFLQSQNNKSINHNIYKKRALVSVDRRFPGANDLIKLIKSRFLSVEELVIEGPEINKADVLSKLDQGYEVYILLGHSVANTTIADSSIFKLSVINKADSAVTTIGLSLSDLKQINWSRADFVFLIGCETANGKIYKGTGLAGIQQCIVALGAQQALACMWEVDARLIIDQIKYLFNSWKPSQNPALVLQEIEINTIKKLQDDTYYKRPHPYIWGSFSLLQTKNMYN